MVSQTFSTDSVDSNFGRIFEKVEGIEKRLDKFYSDFHSIINGQASIVSNLRDKLELNSSKIITLEGMILRFQDMKDRDAIFFKMLSEKDASFQELVSAQNDQNKKFFRNLIIIIGSLLTLVSSVSTAVVTALTQYILK